MSDWMLSLVRQLSSKTFPRRDPSKLAIFPSSIVPIWRDFAFDRLNEPKRRFEGLSKNSPIAPTTAFTKIPLVRIDRYLMVLEQEEIPFGNFVTKYIEKLEFHKLQLIITNTKRTIGWMLHPICKKSI